MSNEKREKKTLTESFEGLTDPRNPDAILHKLIDIVSITILAMINHDPFFLTSFKDFSCFY